MLRSSRPASTGPSASRRGAAPFPLPLDPAPAPELSLSPGEGVGPGSLAAGAGGGRISTERRCDAAARALAPPRVPLSDVATRPIPRMLGTREDL